MAAKPSQSGSPRGAMLCVGVAADRLHEIVELLDALSPPELLGDEGFFRALREAVAVLWEVGHGDLSDELARWLVWAQGLMMGRVQASEETPAWEARDTLDADVEQAHTALVRKLQEMTPEQREGAMLILEWMKANYQEAGYWRLFWSLLNRVL